MRGCVTVSVAARLHLGFLDMHGGLGRRFGSLGVALDQPRTVVHLGRGACDASEGPQADRAWRSLSTLRETLKLPSGHRLTVGEAIPAHAGLGSGTQMALAVAAALRRLHGLPLAVDEDAAALDRGGRSGLGAGFFDAGGVALDGGRGAADRPAPIIARLPFPEPWRVLLILDPNRRGVHGPDEIAAFAALPPFPAQCAAHLCRLAVMQALPAVAEHDLAAFGDAVTEIQAHIGDHFGAAQGGRFASPAVAAALRLLADSGVRGYGQSSWGPTGFAFAGSPAQAEALAGAVAPLAAASGLVVRIVAGRNAGAVLSDRFGTERPSTAKKELRHG